MRQEVRREGRLILDLRLAKLKPEARLALPPRGWIRAIRDSLGMSSSQLGRRLGRVSGTVDDLEKSEAAGTIQLKTLRRVAETLDCTLVYALVPKTSLRDFIMQRARKIAERELRRIDHTMELEDQGTWDVDIEMRISEYVEKHLTDREVWNDSTQ